MRRDEALGPNRCAYRVKECPCVSRKHTITGHVYSPCLFVLFVFVWVGGFQCNIVYIQYY